MKKLEKLEKLEKMGYNEESADYERVKSLNNLFDKLGWNLVSVEFRSYTHPLVIDTCEVSVITRPGDCPTDFYNIHYNYRDPPKEFAKRVANVVFSYILKGTSW